MKEYEREELIVELEQIINALTVMAAGSDAYKDKEAVGCMNMVKNELSRITKRISEMNDANKEPKANSSIWKVPEPQ